MVQCIEENKIDGWSRRSFDLEFREHVESDETGDAEGGGLVEVWEGDFAPAEDVDGVEVVEGVV